MKVKITVVVPVYNPGEFIRPCVESLLRQTMPAGEFEAIFVDDGSTDSTPAYLDEICSLHEHFRVIHQPNSGWPGKPRNEGIKAARGEFVYFVDNDDWIGDEALERLYGWATQQAADVVIGKMIGIRRSVPKVLFQKTYPDADLRTAPLIDSLTPHKLVRRSMLLEKGILFPEGRRRLEDHVFVVRCYFAARNVTVASDYDYYFHIAREDATNAGFRKIDWAGYFTNLREALDVVVASTDDEALRDRLFARWLRVEMIKRLSGNAVLGREAPENAELFTEARQVVREYFRPEVDTQLTWREQAVAAVLRHGTEEDTRALARFLAQDPAAGFVLHRVDVVGDSLVLDVRRDAAGGSGVTATADGLRFDSSGTTVAVPAADPARTASAVLRRAGGRRTVPAVASWSGLTAIGVRVGPSDAPAAPVMADGVWRIELAAVPLSGGRPVTGPVLVGAVTGLPRPVAWPGAVAVLYDDNGALAVDVGPTQARHLAPALGVSPAAVVRRLPRAVLRRWRRRRPAAPAVTAR